MKLFHRLLVVVSFHAFLYRCDQRVAAEFRLRGCRCGGVLDSARYRRRPRGIDLPEEYCRRFSYTCRTCKKRATPPSLLFLGRKVYLATWVLLAVLVTQGAERWSIGRACRVLGLSRRTLVRWRRFWREVLPATAFWRRARASFMPPILARLLPRAMVERFTGTPRQSVHRALTFLAPMTTRCAIASRAR